jgi:hypothetical protein
MCHHLIAPLRVRRNCQLPPMRWWWVATVLDPVTSSALMNQGGGGLAADQRPLRHAGCSQAVLMPYADRSGAGYFAQPEAHVVHSVSVRGCPDLSGSQPDARRELQELAVHMGGL